MDLPKDDFKWFGQGFDGFPKHLPEDSVEYSIYNFSSTLSDQEIRSSLQKVLTASAALAKTYLSGYIWQKEAFKLELKREDGASCLKGRTSYGDSISDEWLIVWLLRELSRQFPQVCIRLIDTDGEFLLIEAANALPRWLTPEVADHRVWISKGELRIIPLSASGTPTRDQPPAPLTLAQARSHISSGREMLHPCLVEDEAFHRLRDYPGQIAQNMHHALLSIPRKLAYLLHQNPGYVSAAVDAFYLRDPIAMRPLKTSKPDSTTSTSTATTTSTSDPSTAKSALAFPPTDFVTALVKFPRVSYAQLKSQHFNVPSAWTSYLSLHSSTLYEDARYRDRAETGMKLTCGFEMLLSDPSNHDDRQVREMQMLVGDVESGDVALPSDEEIENWKDGRGPDEERWMDVNYEEFEAELQGKGRERGKPGGRGEEDGGGQGMHGGFGDKAAQENLRKMVDRFEDFLNDEGDEDDMDADDDESEDEGSGIGEVDVEDEDLGLTEDDFTKMMREMMGMPEEVMKEIMKGELPTNLPPGSTNAGPLREDVPKVRELDEDGDEEDEEIKELSRLMEAELKASGALNLDEPKRLGSAMSVPVRLKDNTAAVTSSSRDAEVEEIESDEEEPLDENYNLAKNMLESFKSQAGAAGPGGNIMGMMGMQFPRDEDTDDDNDDDRDAREGFSKFDAKRQ